MDDPTVTPFSSIEGAHESMRLLGEALEEARRDIQDNISGETVPRTLEALYLVRHKLNQLQQHVAASTRILNDLRTLRRLLFRERDGGLPR